MISFAPMFKYMAEHEIKPNHLVLAGVCDSGTIYRLHHNKNTSMAMIEKIMDFLNCDLKDVMEWIPDTPVPDTSVPDTLVPGKNAVEKQTPIAPENEKQA